MAINRTRIAHLNNYPDFGIPRRKRAMPLVTFRGDARLCKHSSTDHCM